MGEQKPKRRLEDTLADARDSECKQRRREGDIQQTEAGATTACMHFLFPAARAASKMSAQEKRACSPEMQSTEAPNRL
jgi:hypothetical protein